MFLQGYDAIFSQKGIGRLNPRIKRSSEQLVFLPLMPSLLIRYDRLPSLQFAWPRYKVWKKHNAVCYTPSAALLVLVRDSNLEKLAFFALFCSMVFTGGAVTRISPRRIHLTRCEKCCRFGRKAGRGGSPSREYQSGRHHRPVEIRQ